MLIRWSDDCVTVLLRSAAVDETHKRKPIIKHFSELTETTSIWRRFKSESSIPVYSAKYQVIVTFLLLTEQGLAGAGIQNQDVLPSTPTRGVVRNLRRFFHGMRERTTTCICGNKSDSEDDAESLLECQEAVWDRMSDACSEGEVESLLDSEEAVRRAVECKGDVCPLSDEQQQQRNRALVVKALAKNPPPSSRLPNDNARDVTEWERGYLTALGVDNWTTMNQLLEILDIQGREDRPFYQAAISNEIRARLRSKHIRLDIGNLANPIPESKDFVYLHTSSDPAESPKFGFSIHQLKDFLLSKPKEMHFRGVKGWVRKGVFEMLPFFVYCDETDGEGLPSVLRIRWFTEDFVWVSIGPDARKCQ